MEELNNKEREILKSFRYSVADILKPECDDYFLIRWLKARNFNAEKAENMLRKHMLWRKQHRVDHFLQHYQMPEVFEKYHPGGLIGMDKEGSPVWLLNSGATDIKGFMQATSRTDFLLYQLHRLEVLMKCMKEQSKKLKRNIDKNIYIMDEEYLVVSQAMNKPVLETLLQSFSAFEANYPETLKRCYIINVPKPFFVIYNFVKPLLSEDTAKKVRIFGTEGWKDALLEEIDASVLPVRWGGTRVDPITQDPRCPSLVHPGGIVPEKYFLTKQPRLTKESDAESIVLSKRDFEDIPVRVCASGSVVSWEVETEENDLGIGFFFQKSEEPLELEELVPVVRFETFRTAEMGSYECEHPGTYIVRLDNSFSWFSSKKVTYRLQVHSDRNKKLPKIRL